MNALVEWLPTYELGPGNGRNELVLNLLIYGMLLAFVASVLWATLVPTLGARRDRRGRR